MTKKEVFKYWFNIIFFGLFGLVAIGSIIYTVITVPFNFLIPFGVIILGVGAAMCGRVVVTLTKEYFSRKKKEKEMGI